jgi:hypothetical protein
MIKGTIFLAFLGLGYKEKKIGNKAKLLKPSNKTNEKEKYRNWGSY